MINRIFDQVYVINLKKDHDRMARMNDRLKKLGIQYKRIDAVYGKELSNKIIRSETTNLCGNFCSKSAIGCAISHKKAWKDAIINGYKKVLILEDDAECVDNFKQRFSQNWKEIPLNWDVVFLGCSTGCGDRDAYTPYDHLLSFLGGINRRGKKIDTNVMIPDTGLGFHAYAVKTKVIKLFLKEHPKLEWPAHIDLLMSRYNKDMNVYAINPPLIVQKSGTNESNIASNRPYLLNKMFDKIVLNNRGIRLGWQLSHTFGRIGMFEIGMYQVLYLVLGFVLNDLKYLKYFTIFMIFDIMFNNKLLLKNDFVNIGFDIFVFWVGMLIRLYLGNNR